jgi:hypothetical protein
LEFSAVWRGEFVPKQLNSRCVDYQHEADQDRYEQTTHIAFSLDPIILLFDRRRGQEVSFISGLFANAAIAGNGRHLHSLNPLLHRQHDTMLALAHDIECNPTPAAAIGPASR